MGAWGGAGAVGAVGTSGSSVVPGARGWVDGGTGGLWGADANSASATTAARIIDMGFPNLPAMVRGEQARQLPTRS